VTPADYKTSEARAKALHNWFCGEMRVTIAWSMEWLRRWTEWLAAGFNGPQLRQVIQYLKREISMGKRNQGALALTNLLNPEVFQKDLNLAEMIKSGAMDPDRKLAAPPDAPARTAAPTPAYRPGQRAPAPERSEDGPTAAQQEAEMKRRIAELEQLKKTL
jgi:hypothetical protein